MLTLDITCGFMTLFCMMQGSHNMTAKRVVVLPEMAISYTADTPVIDSLMPLDDQRHDAEIEVQKSLEETTLRISHLHHSKKNTVILVDSVYVYPECPPDTVNKRGFFKRLFKIK